MWLVWFCGVVLCCSYSSCATIGSYSFPSHENPDHIILTPHDDEGVPASYITEIIQTPQVVLYIVGQLDRFHNYVTTRMATLEASCKGSNGTSRKGIEYAESSGGFKHRLLNQLVKVMTTKLTEIAEIFVEDLEIVSFNASHFMSENVGEKFTNLAVDLNSLHARIERLAKKEAFERLQANISDLVETSTEELEEYLKTKATKHELASVTRELGDHTAQLLENTETLKTCSSSDELIDDALDLASEIKATIVDTKEAWTHVTADDCPVTPGVLPSDLNAGAEEGERTIERISHTLEVIDAEVTNRLEEIDLIITKDMDTSPKDASPRFPPSHHPTTTTTPTTRTTTTTVRPTTIPSTTQATTEETPVTGGRPASSECLDSTFTGPISPSFVCDTSVRLQGCLLEFFTIHCCRTCREAGYTFDVPKYNGPREVSMMKAVQVIASMVSSSNEKKN